MTINNKHNSHNSMLFTVSMNCSSLLFSLFWLRNLYDAAYWSNSKSQNLVHCMGIHFLLCFLLKLCCSLNPTLKARQAWIVHRACLRHYVFRAESNYCHLVSQFLVLCYWTLLIFHLSPGWLHVLLSFLSCLLSLKYTSLCADCFISLSSAFSQISLWFPFSMVITTS